MTDRKIALIGSAPSSVALAPYDDHSYEIWGCSPGAYPHARRADVWFEIHEWKNGGRPRFTPEYVDFLNKVPKVFMQKAEESVANSEPFPVWKVIAEFGPFLWSSTVSYMMAWAILEQPAEIGMWGIDMAANEEWQDQRHHLQALVQIARNRGIVVTASPHSDILRPGKVYGYCELDPISKKLQARLAELRHRHRECLQLIDTKTRERFYIEGALDDLQYMIKTWTSDPTVAEMGEKGRIDDLRSAESFAADEAEVKPNGSAPSVSLPTSAVQPLDVASG